MWWWHACVHVRHLCVTVRCILQRWALVAEEVRRMVMHHRERVAQEGAEED